MTSCVHDNVGESIGDPAAARWLHYGLGSNDIVDTAQALQNSRASHIIERDLVLFGEVLDLRAHQFRNTRKSAAHTACMQSRLHLG